MWQVAPCQLAANSYIYLSALEALVAVGDYAIEYLDVIFQFSLGRNRHDYFQMSCNGCMPFLCCLKNKPH